MTDDPRFLQYEPPTLPESPKPGDWIYVHDGDGNVYASAQVPDPGPTEEGTFSIPIGIPKIATAFAISDEMAGRPRPVHVPWRRRLWWRTQDRWHATRRAVGYWIAGDRGGWDL